MPKRYSQEIKNFIRDNVKLYSEKDLARVTNEKFGTSFTYKSINSYKKNKGWKRGKVKSVKYSKLFPQEIAEFINKNYNGNSYENMVTMIYQMFERDYTKEQIKTYYKNHNLTSGIDCRYKKGNVPFLKGKKGIVYPGSEKGWFQIGNKPYNVVNVGTEIITEDGYHKIKVGEPNVWDFVHRIIWRNNYGEIPEGMMVSFKDGNKDNVSLENLMLITKPEHIEMIRKHLRFSNAEYTEVGLNIAKLNILVKNKMNK